MKTALISFALLLGTALQMNAQIDTFKGDLFNGRNEPTLQFEHETLDKENVVSFFPNPATNQISIATNSDRFDIIQILDYTGTVIREIPYGMTPLDISDLRSGSYIISFQKKGSIVRQRLEKK